MQVPHGVFLRAVQMPQSTINNYYSRFLRFWTYLHSNESYIVQAKT